MNNSHHSVFGGEYDIVLKSDAGFAFSDTEVENVIDCMTRFVYKHQREPSR